jgi:hypothetical protein
MNPMGNLDLVTWVTAVELPALAGLFWLVWRGRQDAEAETDEIRRFLENGLSRAREELAAYKLEVAKTYASIGYIKDIERRLTEHLVRIETKLDHAQGVRS